MGAGAGDIRAGRAFVEMGTNDAALAKGLDAAKQRLGAFAGALGALGSALALGFVTNKITGWVQAFADSGREIYLMARAAGIGTAELSELKKSVQILGGDFEETVGSMRKMGIFLHDAATGGRAASDALRQLGLSAADMVGKSELDKLQLIGERLAAIGDLNTRQSLGRQIFGRGGGATVGLAGQLGGARASARESGLPTEEEIRRAFELSQALLRLESVKKRAFQGIGAALAPAFTAVIDAITGVVSQVKTWIKANEEIVQKVALIGSGIVGVGAGLLAAAAGVKLILFTAGGIASVFAGVKVLLVTIGALIAFELSKWGILLRIAQLIGIEILRATGALDAMSRAAGRVADVFNEAFGGIKDAIMGGELELAWQVALAGMQVLWVDFQDGFKASFGTSLQTIFNGLKIGWIEAMAFMKAEWVKVSGFLASTWNLSENIQTWINIRHLRNQLRRGEITQDVHDSTVRQLLREQEMSNHGGEEAFHARNAALAQIEAERAAARLAITNAPPGDLTNDALLARIDLDNALEAASIAAGAAAARREAQLGGVAGGMDELGAGSTRSTFNRDVLWGFGGSPIQQLVSQAGKIAEKLELLIPIQRDIHNLVPAEVG